MPQGNLLSNPRRVLLAGLPDKAAVTAAAANGEDWRTVYADGAPVRLFTQKVTDGRGGPPAYLQTGMGLSLQEVQRNEILMTILLASLLGLLGAGVVTLLVTRRALTPVRNAFAAEGVSWLPPHTSCARRSPSCTRWLRSCNAKT